MANLSRKSGESAGGIPADFFKLLSHPNTTKSTLIHKFMDTIEIEREVFDALIERVDFLHKTVKALYNELRDKRLSDWLNTKQTCDYLHISERKLRTMKERGKIGFSHLGRLSQFKGGDIAKLIIKEEEAEQ